MSERDSSASNGMGSDTDCDVSDNEFDVLKVEELESASDNDLHGHCKRV